jgi:hypothetical protein
MSLCRHPRSQIYDDGGQARCSACGDVNEGGRWRPSRDATPGQVCENDCPFANGVGLPYDQNVVMSSFKVAMLASLHERGEPDPEKDKVLVMLDLAADTSRRFSNLMKTLAVEGGLPRSPE